MEQDDFYGDKLAAIAGALSSAQPALAGNICANCGHCRRQPGKLSCTLKGGPRYAETVKPGDSCDGFYADEDLAADKRAHLDIGMPKGATGPAVEEGAFGAELADAAEHARMASVGLPPAEKPGRKAARKAKGKDGGGAPPKEMLLPIPDDLPVKPLGHMDKTYYYLSAANRLDELPAKEHTRLNLAHLFGGRADYLAAWAPAYNAKGRVTGPNFEAIGYTLMHAAFQRGLWDKRDKVRGRGCWTGDAGLIMHLGNRIVAGGKVVQPGELDGFLYPQGSKLPAPATDASHPGADLLHLFGGWNWVRPHLDPLLMTGFAAIAPLGAALKVRPMVFVTGGHGTGKSTLNEALKAILGEWLLWSNDATGASLTAELGADCVAVAVDENEPRPDSNRAQQMIEFARLNYSGGVKRRSDAQHNAHEFTLRSAVFFSAINRPAMEPQDRSRFGLLNLKPLDKNAAEPDLDARRLRDLGQRMLARWLLDWDRFGDRFEAVRRQLKLAGHSARGQDTFGTLLTAAWAMIGDEAVDRLGLPLGKRVSELQDLMRASELAETAGIVPNWRECLDRLIGTPVDAFRNAKRQTIGAVLEAVQLKAANLDDPDGMGYDEADTALKQAGVKLVRPKAAGEPFRLFIPYESEQLFRLYRGSKWAGMPQAGGWAAALEQADQHLWMKDRQRVNTVARGLSFTVPAVMDEIPPGDEGEASDSDSWR